MNGKASSLPPGEAMVFVDGQLIEGPTRVAIDTSRAGRLWVSIDTTGDLADTSYLDPLGERPERRRTASEQATERQ